jgi:hypothetical protein
MRKLGFLLVAAALTLEAGAVAVRPASAEEEAAPIMLAKQPPAADAEMSTAVPAAPAQAAPSEPATCPVNQATPPSVISLPLSEFHVEGYVPLNTRGYNYATPDDAPERYVPDSTGTQPRPID